MNARDLLPVLLPLIAIQLGLQIYSLVDLVRAGRQVRYLPKTVWALVIIFGQLLGSVVYLIVGREEA